MKEFGVIADYLLSDLEKKENYPYSGEIKEFITLIKGNSDFQTGKAGGGSISDFFLRASEIINKEIDEACGKYPELKESLKTLAFSIKQDQGTDIDKRSLLSVFHPEAVQVLGDRKKAVENIREKRTVRIKKLNNNSINDPAAEIIFTSNFMLTVPPSSGFLDKAALPEALKEELRSIMKDRQSYWFDHPVPAGVADENNELIYGLKHLAETLEYEKNRGTCKIDSKLTVFISVSVTHERLRNILHSYLEHILGKIREFRDLDIYIFTEKDTEKILAKILLPASDRLNRGNTESMKKVFGVDGEYGRHYSFLKAVTALWHVLIDRGKKGTFKIDLDQVFPEPVLARETGLSAFEHFRTPLWGAEGEDREGRNVELGMIAGSLVNESDISKSLFFPDVPYPDSCISGEDIIFFKQLPMAVSTEAEMNLDKYRDPDLCIMRYHVTGGTNGILISHLRKHRPFTPTFIGRAEDQAYLLSVLFSDRNSSVLRYLHKPGLKMRHDKEAFASDSIKKAKTGTYVGDLVRIIAFSSYCDILEGGKKGVKGETDPFTGSFISRIPYTLVFFKLLLHINEKLEETPPAFSEEYIENLIKTAADRISAAIDFFSDKEGLKTAYLSEKEGWNTFYDIIDYLEKETGDKTDRGIIFTEKGLEIMRSCKI